MSSRVRDLVVTNKATKETRHDLGDTSVFDMMELEKEVRLAEEVETKLNDLIGEALSDGKAKYKLEVFFPNSRRRQESYPGFISFWSNGGFAHGGGDHNIYLCTEKIEKPDGSIGACASVIDIRFFTKDEEGHPIAICQACKRVIDPEELCGQVFARLTTQNWTRLILKVFQRLEHDADINITLGDGNLRKATEKELKVKYQRGDLINRSRKERQHIQYPLKNIIRDTANGSDLYGRIKAFLSG